MAKSKEMLESMKKSMAVELAKLAQQQMAKAAATPNIQPATKTFASDTTTKVNDRKASTPTTMVIEVLMFSQSQNRSRRSDTNSTRPRKRVKYSPTAI